jgi:hypothetical protein
MLATAESEGVVIKTKTLYDEYFKPDEGKVFADPTSIPYFDGDYIPGEVENIIQDLHKDDLKRCKQKENDANISGVIPRVRLTEEKPVGNKRGTRSNPDLVHFEPDIVMKRLGHSLSQIKRNFFVVYLRSCVFAEAVDKGMDVSKWTEEDDDDFKDKSGYIVGKDASILGKHESFISSRSPPENDANSECEAVCPVGTPQSLDKTVVSDDSSVVVSVGNIVQSSGDVDRNAVETVARPSDSSLAPLATKLQSPDNSNPFTASDSCTGRKTSSQVSDNNSSKVSPTFIGSTVDLDPLINNEIFETRQQFLNFCQTNHYQFDELRRAKHTTMMVGYLVCLSTISLCLFCFCSSQFSFWSSYGACYAMIDSLPNPQRIGYQVFAAVWKM